MQFYRKDTKGVISRRKDEGQTMAKRKSTNNDLQNITLKNKDRATQTQLKTGVAFRCSGRVRRPCSAYGTRPVTLVTTSVICQEGTGL